MSTGAGAGEAAPATVAAQSRRGGIQPGDSPTTITKTLAVEKSGGIWNTSNSGLRLAADGAAAATAGVSVAPVITMIDRAIIENASGRQALLPSLRASLKTLVLRPHHFLLSRPFRLIFLLYTGTYTTANILDTATATMTNSRASSTTAGSTKFAVTSTANLSLSLYKDIQFTRLFGAASTHAVPPTSYAVFALRDCLTIFASFNSPPSLAPHSPPPSGPATDAYFSRLTAAQFIAPAAVQLFSTPSHLLGLDSYNRSRGPSAADRFRKVRVDWLKSSFARMARIVPAFGVGGVVNTGMRSSLMARLE